MSKRDTFSLFLCGDVMTGRGIDQILHTSVTPRLFEPWVEDAREYVHLAERRSGPIAKPVDPSYIWGDALEELERDPPALRIINLETSITTEEEHDREKGIHYRMHPSNVDCLTAAKIDCCCLANNHVLDWGRAGLLQTISVLRGADVRTTGAGHDWTEAIRPAILQHDGGRVLVFAFATTSAGVPDSWSATAAEPGVGLLPHLSSAARWVADHIHAHSRSGDTVIVSLHWGDNWGYAVPVEEQRFARALVDLGAVDVVHGHSSHHPKTFERYRGKLILYGCGDFINDYEGIRGHEAYRGDLAVMYFPTIESATGNTIALRLVPMHRHRMSLRRASRLDTSWLAQALNRNRDHFGAPVRIVDDGTISPDW